MKVIVPCAGRSSRFPNMPPKWMLPDHDGVPMVVRAVEGLGVNKDDLIFTLLREHDERFNATKGLQQAFGHPVHTILLDQPTTSQSETVAETLIRAAIEEPFLVKDSDNYFEIPSLEEPYSYVSVASLNDFDNINPRNKSYVQIDQESIITNFREKRVISDLFSVGGYYFTSRDQFMSAYEHLLQHPAADRSELYLSEIIATLALGGDTFKVKRVKNYQDWGTVHEWRQKLLQRQVYMVSVDGFLFTRESPFFGTGFAGATPHASAITAVSDLARLGHTITYLSVRPEKDRAMTLAQLDEQGLPPGKLVMECGVSHWQLVTSPDATLPFTTSGAIEVLPEDPNLIEKLITRG